MSELNDIDAIKRVLKKYANYTSEGDFDSYMSLWIEKGIQMLPYAAARIGKQQIRRRMKSAFDRMNIDLKINSIIDAKVHGDMGLTVCTYTMKMTPKKGGNTINAVPDGKVLTVYEKQPNGSWKIAYDCSNLSKRTIAPSSI